MKTLSDKIKESIDLIKQGEKLALALNPTDGYFVGFSGGKDSQVLLELVKMAGVKYKAYYNVTTNDPPDNLYFIRSFYPEVTFIHHHPNLYTLISSKGLPTIFHRWCCRLFKEGAGVGNVVLTGVRREESYKRANYTSVDVQSRRKEHIDRTTQYSIDNLMETHHDCIKGQDKIMINPLADWTTTDIWVYIAENKLPVNPCYKISHRVGCMFCPYSSEEQITYYETTYPLFHHLLLANLQLFLDKKGGDKILHSTLEHYNWWKSGKPLNEFIYKRNQTTLEFYTD